MQNRYSIQQFDTKKAALDALEGPSSVSAEATCSSVPEPVDFSHPSIQAQIEILKTEIARLSDRQFDLALQDRSYVPKAPEAVSYHERQVTNLIAFPGRSHSA
jgi:hypothetical protein